MLLMPEPLVAEAMKCLGQSVTGADEVWAVADRMHTSFTATLDHLCNLGYLDDATRDAMREEIETRATAKAFKPRPSS